MFKRFARDRMRIGALEVQLDFAGADAGQVEQVVDQARLELDVAADKVDLVREFFRQLGRVLGHETGGGEGGGEGCAQFVAERGEEFILRAVCLLRGDLLGFGFARADLIGDIAGDFRETAQLAIRVAQSGDDDIRLERGAIFPHADALIVDVARARGVLEVLLRATGGDIFGGVEAGEMFADDLLPRCSPLIFSAPEFQLATRPLGSSR